MILVLLRARVASPPRAGVRRERWVGRRAASRAPSRGAEARSRDLEPKDLELGAPFWERRSTRRPAGRPRLRHGMPPGAPPRSEEAERYEQKSSTQDGETQVQQHRHVHAAAFVGDLVSTRGTHIRACCRVGLGTRLGARRRPGVPAGRCHSCHSGAHRGDRPLDCRSGSGSIHPARARSVFMRANHRVHDHDGKGQDEHDEPRTATLARRKTPGGAAPLTTCRDGHGRNPTRLNPLGV